jgi:DNA-binding transcriptional LysR family regulator
MSITLRRIRSFIAVAEFGGFRKAAEALAISQPALSGHIQELEEEVGVALFRRTTRQVHLTDNGKTFLARVKRTLGDLDASISDLREQATNQRGQATIACVPAIASSVFPRLLQSFKRDHPDINIQLYDERTELIEKRVLLAEVDFAIAPGLANSSELCFEPIMDDPFCIVFPKDHPLSQSTSASLADLTRFPLIAMRPQLSMRKILDGAADQLGLKLQPAYEVFNHDTLIGMVAAGLGIGAMPSLTISMVGHAGVSSRQIIDPIVSRKIGIITRRGESLTHAADLFAERVRSYLGQRAAAGSAAGVQRHSQRNPKLVRMSR